MTLLRAEVVVLPGETAAQEIDFGKVDKFELLASGTLRVDAPPKTIVDDGERHVVILTILNADVPRRKSIGDRRGRKCSPHLGFVEARVVTLTAATPTVLEAFFRQFIIGRARAFVWRSKP